MLSFGPRNACSLGACARPKALHLWHAARSLSSQAALPGRRWSGCGAAAARPSAHATLLALDQSSKWLASGALFGGLLWRPADEATAWCIVGAVASAKCCKLLKVAINQQRPSTSSKGGPGMPSSHANALLYLSTFAALSLSFEAQMQPAGRVLAGCALAAGAFLSGLRVYCGFHSPPQVLAGAALGAATGASWWALGCHLVLPALQQHPGGANALFAATLMMTGYAAKHIMAWAQQAAQQQRQQRSIRRRQAHVLLGLRRGLRRAMQHPALPAARQLWAAKREGAPAAFTA